MKKPIRITIISAVSAVSAVIIAAASFAASSVYRNSTGYHISLAERYLSEMNYEQAIIEFEKLIEIEPRNADLWLGLADAYSMTGRPDKAREVLKRALESVSDNRINAKLAGIEPDETSAAVSEVETSVPLTAPLETTTITTTAAATEEVIVTVTVPEDETPDTDFEVVETAAVEPVTVASEVTSAAVTTTVTTTITEETVASETAVSASTTTTKKAETTPKITKKTTKETTSETTPETTPETSAEEEAVPKEYTADGIAEMIRNYILYGGELDEEPLKKVDGLTIIGTEIVRVGYNNEIGGAVPDIRGFMFRTPPEKAFKLFYNDGSEKVFGCGNITDISFIERMPSLKVLDIWYNSITDISSLSFGDKISDLGFSGNNIRDISALKGLTGIEILKLSNNNIDFNIFAETASKMPALKRVDLGCNGITDINDIYKLKDSGVYEIWLNNNKIRDISPIRYLTGLRVLAIDGNDISDISALESLTNLEQLRIGNVPDKSVLKKLTNLRELSIVVYDINDMPSESQLEELRTDLPNCDIRATELLD